MPKEDYPGLRERAEPAGPVRLKAGVRAGQGGYAEGIARRRRGQRGGGEGERPSREDLMGRNSGEWYRVSTSRCARVSTGREDTILAIESIMFIVQKFAAPHCGVNVARRSDVHCLGLRGGSIRGTSLFRDGRLSRDHPHLHLWSAALSLATTTAKLFCETTNHFVMMHCERILPIDLEPRIAGISYYS